MPEPIKLLKLPKFDKLNEDFAKQLSKILSKKLSTPISIEPVASIAQEPEKFLKILDRETVIAVSKVDPDAGTALTVLNDLPDYKKLPQLKSALNESISKCLDDANSPFHLNTCKKLTLADFERTNNKDEGTSLISFSIEVAGLEGRLYLVFQGIIWVKFQESLK